MNLSDVISLIHPLDIKGSTNITIQQITFDSRKVKAGSLFVAIRGTQVDGHKFIDKAVENGAIAIIVEQLPEVTWDTEIPIIQVKDSAHSLGVLADWWYGQPSSKLKLVGVTGTNGKTTCVTLLYDLFSSLGFKCGLLSTIENKIGQLRVTATHTTPDVLSINALLADMVDIGCSFAFMEVSSHAVHQKRIAGLQFSGGVFTNISHDHLDYHKTFKAYIEAKKAFFDQLPSTAFALTNLDDKRGQVMVQNTEAKVFTYSLRTMASYRAKILENLITGLHLLLDEEDFYSPLIGQFNAYNLLTVYAVGILLAQDKLEVLTALSKLQAAEGRFDYIIDKAKNILAIVDYAHTPDALEKVLATVHGLKSGSTEVITVVGCGGDRDRKKRPSMGKIASENSDHVIFTSDNPRSESPDDIIREMEAGVPIHSKFKVLPITDRKQAIRTAYRIAKPNDIILVAGKGHEKYQETKGVRHPFDDKEVLAEAFDLAKKS